MKRILPIILLITLLGVGLSACTGNPSKTLSGSDQDAVLVYADPVADNLLAGLNAGDYAAFSRDFSDAIKKAIPETSFPQLQSQVTGKIGKYVSRQVSSVVETGSVETVLYNAKFEQDDPVTVRLALQKDAPHQVVGLWFSSAKLAGK